ncbi:MAG: phospholipase D-like domain-containing protein [Bacteroidota bacterium]
MTNPKTSLSVKLYKGDAKVLIACNLDKKDCVNLAGFTIQCKAATLKPYYIYNMLQFKDPAQHAQVATEPAQSSINAPFQKFRWLHVPGIIHQQEKVVYGTYIYTVYPRYFENNILLPIDKTLAVIEEIEVNAFAKGPIELAFTRGFTQSQAFTRHFGPKAKFKPYQAPLLFNPKTPAGTNNLGESYTYEDEYKWSGFTAREKIFDLVKSVVNDKDLFLDLFAYDLSEPDLLRYFLQLGKEGRIRIALDSADLHHNPAHPKAEDQFETAFRQIDSRPGGKDSIKRGQFKRYQHHKIMLVSRGKNRAPVKMLSGSTNFSVTGMYANSNHVIIFNDTKVVQLYQQLFETAWAGELKLNTFLTSDLAKKEYAFDLSGIPMSVTFAPHEDAFALANLQKIVTRIEAEKSSVLFAVMGTDTVTHGPVAPALIKLHEREDIFSAGITDSTNSLTYYKPSSLTGIRVTGLPNATILPPPFAEETPINIGHQVHHKFIVCAFNTPQAVVWLGSSNLAEGGETENGDNLIEIHDQEIATVFALEALALVDHFHFRDQHEAPKKPKDKNVPTPVPPKPIAYYLYTNGKWAASYFKTGDLHCLDRKLFA